MKSATFWRTENKAQRGNTSTLADDKYVIISQTSSSDLYLPTQKESLGFTLQLAKAGGDRGQRVPQGIPSVGRRKSVRSSTSLRSHREESRPCSGGVHSTLPSAGIRQSCAYTHWHRYLHKGGLARVSCAKHCPPPSFSSLPPDNF